MTAHGAKGLQAPLVILADATADPESRPRSTMNWKVTEDIESADLPPEKGSAVGPASRSDRGGGPARARRALAAVLRRRDARGGTAGDRRRARPARRRACRRVIAGMPSPTLRWRSWVVARRRRARRSFAGSKPQPPAALAPTAESVDARDRSAPMGAPARADRGAAAASARAVVARRGRRGRSAANARDARRGRARAADPRVVRTIAARLRRTRAQQRPTDGWRPSVGLATPQRARAISSRRCCGIIDDPRTRCCSAPTRWRKRRSRRSCRAGM